MAATRTVRLPADSNGRLDAALARLQSGWSRRELKTAFKDGRVRVDGRPVLAATPVKGGMEVTLCGVALAAGLPPTHAPDLVVIYQDLSLVVIDKPAGVPAYALRATEEDTVGVAVRHQFPDVRGVGDMRFAPGLCHRLDKETSGLLVFARTPAAFTAMRTAFHERQITKVYQAVVAGRLTGEGVMAWPLGRPIDRRARMVVVTPKMRRSCRKVWPAVTRWRTVEHTSDRTLVELVLETGVTHQARVHLAHLGYPIVGDTRYGGERATRLALHAWRLVFAHPVTGELLRLESRTRLRASGLSGDSPAQ